MCVYVRVSVPLICSAFFFVCRESTLGVINKVLDCDLEVSEFELKSYCYLLFRTDILGKDMKPLILPAVGSIVSVQYFNKNSIGIK